MPTHHGAVGYNLESRQLIDSAFMRNLMGDSAEQDFIFEDGFYPRLRHMDERPGRLAASPILLYPEENADSVTLPFYVDTNYGVRWVSLSEDIIRIEGNVGYVRHPVLKDTTVRVEAWKEDFNKHVYLTVPASNYVYQDLLSDTICPGDSVKMINSYARNEGWNYEVVETASAEYDTIYRMYLYHYPTYREVVHRAAVERDSLPYILGKDTIRNFGLTELRRYQSVHGCDSITYVRLDTLYIHRARHFYDTLQACGETVLSWRGKEITQTGDYADTVFDPYKGGTDSIYHLRADIYPVYHETYTDSCYAEELPYRVGDVFMQDFGEQTECYVTVDGCDSVRTYVLSRRFHYYRVQVDIKGEGFSNITDTLVCDGTELLLRFSTYPCHTIDSLTIDGVPVSPSFTYLLKDLHSDCRVEAVFSPIWKIVDVAIDTVAPLCEASQIQFSCDMEQGNPTVLHVGYNDIALASGFSDTVLKVWKNGYGRVDVLLPLPEESKPNRYGMSLLFSDSIGCYTAEKELFFEIPYPSTIIVQKWSDVLAVLSAEYNGGYEFSGYQWYKNGEAIEGATRPYYQAKPYLRSTDTYAVLLERASDGLKLQSCGVKRKSYPKELLLELLPNPTASGEAVRVRVDGKPDAEGVIEVFDGIGKPVYERPFRESHILPANWQPGTYVVRVRNAKSTWIATGKLVIR